MASEMVINLVVVVAAVMAVYIILSVGLLISQQAILSGLLALLVILVTGRWLYRRIS